MTDRNNVDHLTVWVVMLMLRTFSYLKCTKMQDFDQNFLRCYLRTHTMGEGHPSYTLSVADHAFRPSIFLCSAATVVVNCHVEYTVIEPVCQQLMASRSQYHLGDNHTNTPPLIFTGQMPYLPPNQQHQSTESKMLITVS